MRHAKAYPADWPAIAERVKAEAGWRCVRCGHPHEEPGQPVPCDAGCDLHYHAGGQANDGLQRMLTVHHLDRDPSNCRWWNLAALCQRCHLHVQGKVLLRRGWMFAHSPWFQPYVAGWYAHLYLGLELSREQVMARLPELLALEGGQ